MNDTRRMRPPRLQKNTAPEAEALVTSGRHIDQIIWSEFGNQQWARIFHGCYVTARGEMLIADLRRLGRSACNRRDLAGDEAWTTLSWSDRQGRWPASGFILGGGEWWSEDVTWRRADRPLGRSAMTPEDFSAPPIVRRLRLWMLGSISGTQGFVAAHRASWAFRQKPVASHDQPRSWGFEVETLMLPSKALAALEATGAKGLRATELWSRPARPGEGKGPWREPPITASKRKMDEVVYSKPKSAKSDDRQPP